MEVEEAGFGRSRIGYIKRGMGPWARLMATTMDGELYYYHLTDGDWLLDVGWHGGVKGQDWTLPDGMDTVLQQDQVWTTTRENDTADFHSVGEEGRKVEVRGRGDGNNDIDNEYTGSGSGGK